MSDDQKKQAPPPATGPQPPLSAQPQKLPQPVKSPLISRRAFVIGAIGASTLLAFGAFATSSGFLRPLIPNPESENGVVEHTIIDWRILENNYQLALSNTPGGQALDPLDLVHQQLNPFASFFYWPYDATASPYYKDVVVRLPDKNPDGSPVSLTSQSNLLVLPPSSSPTGARFVAFNTTCVHLRCLVNPGYSSEYRLLCPCHGSQYRLVDGVPVAGPAFDLGLLPLPQVKLTLDSTGTRLVAVPFGTNADGSPILLNGEPGIGRS